MNRKDRDQLLQYAFGELDDAAMQTWTARIESDEALRREVGQLNGMSDALSTLRSVPECQVSVERIRDAVLRNEMGSRKRPAWVRIAALAPIAATCLGVAVFLRLNNAGSFDHTGPGALVRNLAPAGSPKAESADVPMIAVDPTESDSDSSLGPIRTTHVPRATKPTPVVNRTPAPTRPLLASRGGSRGTLLPPDAETRAATSDSEEATNPSVEEFDPSNESSKVVIINADKSDGYGAMVASEVETNEHVLIGG